MPDKESRYVRHNIFRRREDNSELDSEQEDKPEESPLED